MPKVATKSKKLVGDSMTVVLRRNANFWCRNPCCKPPTCTEILGEREAKISRTWNAVSNYSLQLRMVPSGIFKIRLWKMNAYERDHVPNSTIWDEFQRTGRLPRNKSCPVRN